MVDWRIKETKNANIKAKIIDLKNQGSCYYPGLITVRKVELKAQNFKNKIIKQSYSVDFFPYITGLYINKTNIYTKKIRFLNFENSDIYYTYNVSGEKNRGYIHRQVTREIKFLNKELFRLKKSSKPLELLSKLFDDFPIRNLSTLDLYTYYDQGHLYLMRTNYEKECTVFSTVYLHIWKKFIFETYKDTVLNLTLETLNKYNAFGLCKLQTALDLSELGYKIPYASNPLETLFFYLKKEKDYKTALALENFKYKQNSDFYYYLKNLNNYNEKNFLKEYINKYEPNKFEAAKYMWQITESGFEYLTQIHFLEHYYKLFGFNLINAPGISHAKYDFYLLKYCFLEGPCLTAPLELQKIKNLNIAGVRIKKNSFLYKLNLEQICLVSYLLSADLD